MRPRHTLLLPALLLIAAAPARAGTGPILHEQIPPDPHEDLALQVSLDGEIPAAIDTKSGVVAAPDPRRAIAPNDPSYGNGVGLPGGPRDRSTDATYTPDRDTRRPDIAGYDEPFTPSTAPFKRLQAFDAVTNDYQLYVRDPALAPLPVNAIAATDGSEEQFFADMVIDVAPGRRARIASVGPGARVVRARLGIGAQDVAMRLTRDGADNWFAEGLDATSRARLVMEVTIPRGVFGGEFVDASWGQLPPTGKLPDRPARAAKDVAAAIGVSTSLRPRDNVNRLVTWFRSFVDSNEPPTGKGDIYLDLALSKKGVCRHRAFAFLITAQSIGIPTRMVLNEAHAWVEVHDGTMWRRIDLGGAGRMPPASNLVPERPAYQSPPDPFQWPHGSERGDDMVDSARQRARAQAQQQGNGAGGDGGAPAGAASMSTMPSPSGDPSGAGFEDGGASLPSPSSSNSSANPNGERDDRPTSTITISVTDADAHRGAPLHVRGDVKADGDRCGHVVVELYLRDAKDPRKLLLLGTAATAADGNYAAAIVIPGSTPLGDYDLVARTQGDTHCGRGSSQ
jgi:transglutaminase-like putative cysteine protease